MSSSSLIVALDSQKKGLKHLYWANQVGYLDYLRSTFTESRPEKISDEHLTKQILGYDRQGIIESRAICAAPLRALSPQSYQYYAPCEEYDSTAFFEYCNTILRQRNISTSTVLGVSVHYRRSRPPKRS
ncbi:hypothetical protein L486_02355 [Kwoniella mangroviensis CBS 10435]|uniref:Uncharacterized protein n=1 Tax=Kwoniella mangroviensis CBS 10435 TaxID=1331196 RepID=A0A1B9IVY1_9TREE|nr:uncharacterized protein I203_04482 [Kwoniella mangroviensis CBS 8507]OCF59683.1 hypothetical protein L486_02355 [Kwoniella mangroviensis CBS 10435]OCF66156.1 hypothetical protein I203_04482 [Kwoniella mangroviensis CBS 8507]OCF71204.1 hypothetical protein I204_08157 [Kwoniella mangroviensis CBS 8886]